MIDFPEDGYGSFEIQGYKEGQKQPMMAEIHCDRLVPPDVAFSAFSIVYLHLLTCSYPSVANHLWRETSLNCQEIYLHTNQNIYAIAIMSNYGTHRQSLAHPRQSTNHTNHTSHTTNPYASSTTHQTSSSRLSTLPTQASKQRQLSHLNSQLAQLTAHMSDLENLLRMTAVQAEGMRGLGGYAGGMFMAASKVLGEEAVKNEGPGEGKR